MIEAAPVQRDFLDIPTLVFAAVCIAGFLGVFLLLTWMKQRDVRALAWWGSAYLIGASAIALLSMPAPLFRFPSVLAEALTVIACGMIWNGVRLFHGRRLLPVAAFSGAIAWIVLSQLPGVAEDMNARIGLGAIVIAVYTFFIAFELLRERRKSHYSPVGAIVVPFLYASIFLMPLAMRALFPDVFAARWLTVLAIETIIYAVGTAFIVLLMVKDQHVHFYRNAATTDNLTGLLNRGAFLDAAGKLQAYRGARGEPVTLLMFDLDHFKSVNDRFGHATGDSVLRVFAQTARSSMRASDIVGRLGGEEFVAIVPEPMDGAVLIAERLRTGFQTAGVVVDNQAIGATVSIGLATSYQPVPDIDALLSRADAALYRAKHEGRNRFRCAEEEPGSEEARAQPTAPSQPPKPAGRFAARRANPADAALAG